MGCGCSSATTYTPSKGGANLDQAKATPASDSFITLFGEKLKGKSGEINTTTALAGKTAVAIYFSAHWCPPCRGFTPQLAKAYKNALAAKGLEIVFVSSDRSEGDFANYYKEMPWLAVPFSSRDVKERLSKKFKVQGIPSLVILDAEANIITADGRSKVMSDPKGAGFPWKPRSFHEIIGDKFRKGDAVVGKEAIMGKTLGIYFSAHWCPPCRGFTPLLAQHYKSYKDQGLPFEIIFSTGDRSESEFNDYYKEMHEKGGDWLALPWGKSAERQELDSLFGVSGIPCLVIVDENGNVINKNARGIVTSDPTGEKFPWAPPAVGNLAQPEGIEQTPSLCVFMEGAAPDQQKLLMSQMEQVAAKYVADAKAKGEDAQYLFFAATSSDGPVGQIRTICDTPIDGASQPVMLLLDISDNGAFYKSEDLEITADTIEAFLKAYESKSVARKQLKAPQ